jgi:hypothetical protein
MRRCLILLLLLSGCANLAEMRAERDAQLASFIGQSEADLVRALGVPSRQFDADGHRFLAYVERRVELVPGSIPFRPYRFGYGYGPGFPPQAIERSCETTFEVVTGKVLSYAIRGDACG